MTVKNSYSMCKWVRWNSDVLFQLVSPPPARLRNIAGL